MIHERYPIDEARVGIDPTYEPYLEEGFIEEVIIGSLNLEIFGLCNITIFSEKEKCIPHFHIINEEYTKELCVCIFSSNYYAHDGKSILTLNDIDKYTLDQWLRADSTTRPFIKRPRWRDIIMSWDGSNSNTTHGILSQPDYTTMINFRN